MKLLDRWAPTIKFGEVAARHRTFNGREAVMNRGGIVDGDATKRRFRSCLISEGPGNLGHRHWYLPEAIRSGVEVFEGAKCMADHPTMSEQFERPERSVRDQVGHFENVQVVTESDGRLALYADLVLLPGESDLLKHTLGLVEGALAHHKKYGETKQPLFGLSINADGEDRPAEINGEEWFAVTRFTGATSADLVTFPGARGRIIGNLESLRVAQRAGNKREARRIMKNMLKDLTASIEKMAGEADEGKRALMAAELRGLLNGMSSSEGEDAPAGDEPAKTDPDPKNDGEETPEQTEAKKRAADAEEALKKAEEVAKKAAEAAPTEEGDSQESLAAKATAFREAAKAVADKTPTLAGVLNAQADAIEKRGGDFSKLRTRVHESEARSSYLESVLRAQKLFLEAGLPEGVLKLDALYGLTEEQQKAKLAETKAMYEKIKADVAGTDPLAPVKKTEAAAVGSPIDLLARHGAFG